MPPVTHLWDGSAAEGNVETEANWSSGADVVDTDSIIFPAMAASATKDVLIGFTPVIPALVETWVEEGCYLNFMNRTTAFALDTDYFTYRGAGNGFFNLTGCTLARIEAGAAAASGNTYGLYLTGATTTTLVIDCGDGNTVGLASLGLDTGTWTNVQIDSGTIDIGDGAAITTLTQSGGVVVNKNDGTNVSLDGNSTYTQEVNNPGTLAIRSGTVYYNSTDVPTGAVSIYAGGVLDFTQDGRAKNWSAVTINAYGGTIRLNGSVTLPSQAWPAGDLTLA